MLLENILTCLDLRRQTQYMSDSKKQREQKTFLGIPMNWDLQNWHQGLWNPDDNSLFPPKRFGIGWTINLHALLKALKLIK